MFYEHIILAKKGPLARIWLAAHWDKKITKAHVFETNIEKSVEGILQPKVKLALRTSGHLLLGVVRIYSRKAKYLLADCNEAFVKIKMAFRPGMVDLPEGHREANVNAITLPEVFHDFDTVLPEINDMDIEAQFSINQSRADEITMREDYGSLSISLHDDGFGDIGFEADTPEVIRGSLALNINEQLFDDEHKNVTSQNTQNALVNDSDLPNEPLDGDGFGDAFSQPELFEDDLFEESQILDNRGKDENKRTNLDDSGERLDNCENVTSPLSSCANSPQTNNQEYFQEKSEKATHESVENSDNTATNQATLRQNEDESFALAPIDASAFKGITKTKRKRKLIVDEIKNISGEEMKAQLADTSDIITTLDLAPPTKRLMYWKETGGVEKLFALPSRCIPARSLFASYSRHLISHSALLEDLSNIAPADVLALDNCQFENESSFINLNSKSRGRKRKQEVQNTSNVDGTGDSILLSLAGPEPIRQEEYSSILSHVSLNIGTQEQSENSLSQIAGTNFLDKMQNSPLTTMYNMSEAERFASLNDMSLEPKLKNQVFASDDYQHGDLTPIGLDHGDLTPHHPGIETIESIPNLPADQVSSILNEAENMHSNLIRQTEISTEWSDYDFQQSTEMHNISEEQMENETDEQFEERVLNKRAAQLFYAVRSRLTSQNYLLLSYLTNRNSRKQAAQKFYSLLVLKKFRALNITQNSPYADITISHGPMFENPKL